MRGGTGTIAVYVEAENVDLSGGDHVIGSHGDRAIALTQANDSVRDGLKAGLPGAFNAEGNLVAAKACYRKAVIQKRGVVLVLSRTQHRPRWSIGWGCRS